tara:strand:- start:46 stop:291 length:246 start_codon:yes stop_codon:yes gene_type:complete
MTNLYLIYTTEQEGWDRSEQEGIRLNLSYHTEGKGSRWLSVPKLTSNNKWALNVEGFELSEEEQSNATSNVSFPNPVSFAT